MPLNNREYLSLRKGQELWDKGGLMLLWMTFSYGILPLWSSYVSATVGRPGSPASCSQTHHPIPALPQAQRLTFSSTSKSIPLPLIVALKLSSLQQATTLASLLLSSVPSSRSGTLLWKSPSSLSTLHTPLSFQSPSPPSLLLWIKFKILALIFIALYNSRQLLLAHNCCNNLSMVAIHSYIPMSTPTHTPAHKHGMCWLMKDIGTIKAKSSIYFCGEC